MKEIGLDWMKKNEDYNNQAKKKTPSNKNKEEGKRVTRGNLLSQSVNNSLVEQSRLGRKEDSHEVIRESFKK